MATAQQHLDDLKWLFTEKGLQHVHAWFQQLFSTPLSASITAPATIGSIEVDDTSHFAAAPEDTVKPSGQLNLLESTTLEFGDGAVSKEPNTNLR